MFQIRIHGRGGQGVVTAAEILSIAAFLEGKYAVAFPTFGSERMGAPVTAFCRIDSKRIRLREPVVSPDAVIIQDATLLRNIPVFAGLPNSGCALINTSRSLEELGISDLLEATEVNRCRTLPASLIALEHTGRPIPNAALLGGFAGLTNLLKFESIAAAIRDKFPGQMGEKNAAAALTAYELVCERNVGYAPAN